MQNTVIRVAKGGLITLPKVLREDCDIRPGDLLTVFDIGGVFVLSSRCSKVNAIADKVRSTWQGSGETLESMLQTLREERGK